MTRAGLWIQHLATPPFWVVRGHEIAHRLWLRDRRYLARLVRAWTTVLTGAEIHPATEIGSGLSTQHPVGIVINGSARIGRDCVIHQCVTLGQIRPSEYPGERVAPVLGDRVEIGANAVLLGPITVGDDAKIGAGAVVLCDVPAGWTAVGNPARLLPPKAERGIPIPRAN